MEIELDRRGNIEEIEALGHRGFPARSVESLVPPAVRRHSAWPTDGYLHKLELERSGQVEIEGYRAGHGVFEAEFSADGRLIEMETKR